MKNLYIYIYSRFYYFALTINTSKFYASVVAVGIFSGLPGLNIMVFLTNILNVDYNKYKNIYVISFVIFYLINFFYFIVINKYYDIETDYDVSQRSRTISNIFVIVYILVSFFLLFL